MGAWWRISQTVVMLLACVVLTVIGFVTGRWALGVAMLLLAVLCLEGLRRTARGGDPWWMRTSFDRRKPL